MKAPIVALIVVVVAAGAGVYYYYSIGGLNSVQSQQSVQTQQAGNGMTGLEIAGKISTYMDTQRNPDGFYNYTSNCGDNCSFDQVYNNANTWTTYANIGMYQATGDSKYLDAAKRDADTMLAWCSQDSVQCIRVLYQIDRLYQITGDRKYSDFVTSEARVLIGPNNPYTYTDDPAAAMYSSIDSIELADAYNISGDGTLLSASLEKLSNADAKSKGGQLIFESNGNKFYVYGCWPQLAKLRLFGVTGDKKYLDGVKAFADAYDMPQMLPSLWFMTDMEPCIDVYQQLGQITGDKAYTDGSNAMITYVLKNFWDTPASVKVAGDNAIKSTQDQTYESITDSSYMVYLLSNADNKSFEVT